MKSLSPAFWFFSLLGLVAAVGLFIFTQPLWTSLLIAGLLAYMLNPLVDGVERRWPGRRKFFVPLIFAAVLLFVIGLLLLLGALIWDQVPGWSQELSEAFLEMRRWLERPFVVLGFTINPQALIDYLERAAGTAVSTIPSGSADLLGGITTNLIWTVVVLVSLFYFLRDGRSLRSSLVERIPPPYRQEVTTLAEEIDQVWRVFLRVQLLIFAILGVLVIASTSLIIWLFRNGWLPLSPIGLIVLLIVVYTAIQQVDNLWLRPRYMGQTLKLHAGVVIVSLLAALALTGVFGALLIVPVLATGKVLGLYFYNRLFPSLEEIEEAGESVTAEDDQTQIELPAEEPAASGDPAHDGVD